MARTVVLVRHGKAERARDHQADIDRKLTPAGVQALAEAFPRTFSLLAGPDVRDAQARAQADSRGAEAPTAGADAAAPAGADAVAGAATAGANSAAAAGADAATAAVTTAAAAPHAPTPTPVIVWVSPAVRARQTCGEVVAALSQNHIAASAPEEHESLWYQDPVTFLDELAATPEDATVIAVGHIPFMSGMVARLCGVELAFRPGGVAAVTVEGDPRQGTPGELLWFVQGPRVRS